MAMRILKKIASLELEEQILNAGALVALVGIFLPWAGGEWLGGESVTYSGFGFYTGYLGIATFGLLTFTLLLTIIPLTGGPALIHKRNRDLARFLATTQSTILTLASLTVLAKTTLEFARMEIRFGIYVSLVGSLVASLYSFLRYQERKRNEVQELFHHPEDEQPKKKDERSILYAEHTPPPPPPPPALNPEEHRVHPAPRSTEKPLVSRQG